MDKILFNHMDINNAGTYVYESSDPDVRLAYKDAECTIPFNPESLKEVFLKGCVIVDRYGMFVRPIGFTTADNGVVLMHYNEIAPGEDEGIFDQNPAFLSAIPESIADGD